MDQTAEHIPSFDRRSGSPPDRRCSATGRYGQAQSLELLGEPACRQLLAVLELPEPERAALIGRLYARGEVLADVLADIETDPDDLVRLRLIAALREVLG